MLTEKDQSFVENIQKSNKTIYDKIDIGDPLYWIPTDSLERILNEKLRGFKVFGLPLRTRSKVIKEQICKALGYPIPTSFKKIQPRFFGQNFDSYGQKANNLQIWNEELSPTRRYALIHISEDDVISRVKVVMGHQLAELDTTGTLTQKYQARVVPSEECCELISKNDTENIRGLTSGTYLVSSQDKTSDLPVQGKIIPIGRLYDLLRPIVGLRIPNVGQDQERLRGVQLQELICKALGYKSNDDNGQCPDILQQLIEIKLQTSPTIDLGLICPNSEKDIGLPKISNVDIRHCDIRYVIVYGRILDNEVQLTNLYLTTGESFFTRFPQFQGKKLNKKLQILLPVTFFDN